MAIARGFYSRLNTTVLKMTFSFFCTSISFLAIPKALYISTLADDRNPFSDKHLQQNVKIVTISLKYQKSENWESKKGLWHPFAEVFVIGKSFQSSEFRKKIFVKI